MAVVRELITLLGTEVDTSGFQQYEAGIARLKSLAINAAKFIGIAFSVDKIIEFADGLVTAGKEINKLSAQLKVIARPFDDMAAAQEKVFETAQRLGLSYKDVLSTYKEFQNEMRETTIPANDIVAATENIYKTLQVSRLSAEGMSEALDLFNRSFQRGSFRSVGIGRLQDISPRTFDVLAQSFAKSRKEGESLEDMMRRLAKEGKVTADAVVSAFAKSNAALDAEWAKVPQKLDKVFVRIYNDLTAVTAQIYKMTDASVFMGRVVWAVWVSLRTGVKWLVDSLGGLESAISLVGIALALVFGPKLIAMLGYATVAMGRFAIANALALAPWIAMGAAVLFVAGAIQDLVYWVQGKKNFIGTWVGPFEDLKKNFENLNIFAGFRIFSDLYKGDFEAFRKDFKILMDDASAQIALLVTAVGGIGLAFFAVIPFVNGVIKAIQALTAEAKVAETAIKATEAASSATPVGTGTGTGGKPTPVPPGPASRPPGPSGPWQLLGALGVAASSVTLGLYGEDWIQQGFDWALGRTDEEIRKNRERDKALYGEGRNTVVDFLGRLPGQLMKRPEPSKDPFTGYGSAPSSDQPFTGYGTSPTSDQPFSYSGPVKKSAWFMPPQPMDPGIMGPPVAPGPRTTNIQPTFNQNIGGIRIETALDAEQIASVLGSKINSMTTDLFSSFTRDMQTTAPRVEAATQN